MNLSALLSKMFTKGFLISIKVSVPADLWLGRIVKLIKDRRNNG